MMTLTTTTFVSLDGVMQGIGAPDEDRRGGFGRGGWTTPLWDPEAGDAITATFERASAFLFGRWTYEVFAGSWGQADPDLNPVASALHHRPKYVVSTTLTDPPWANTVVLSDDWAGAVADIKAAGDGELQVHGSGVLARSLLEAGLVDEIQLFTFPAIVGAGTRLFPDAGTALTLRLLRSQTTPGGIVIHSYRPDGPLQFEASSADLEAFD